MTQTIMVPLDGSAFAERAVEAAIALARTGNVRVHLVQAHEPPIVPSSPDVLVPYDAEWDAVRRREEQEYLQTVANRVSERAGVPVRSEVVDGPPAMSLAMYARDMEVDLIVMTTHGRSGLSRLWLGSVADGVVRRSGVPVLLIRAGESATEPIDLYPRHILIPLDGSELSKGVLEPALWLGSIFGARYTLLRVVLPAAVLRPPVTLGDSDFVDGVLAEQETHAKEFLEGVAKPLRARGLDVETLVVSHSVPAQAILEQSEACIADMVAIATHGRGGWSRLALGSVADKVLRASSVPALVYRPSAKVNNEQHAFPGVADAAI